MEDPGDGEPLNPCMDVYKGNVKSEGSLDKLNLRILLGRYFENKEMVVHTWYPTKSMRNLIYFLVDASKHKSRIQI